MRLALALAAAGLLAAASSPAFAQLSITAIGNSVIVGFDEFTGAGFSPGALPASGELDSNTYSVGGMDPVPSCDFGATCNTPDTDFARGTTAAAVTAGGVYAFDVGGNIALGFQPTSADFTPGTLRVRIDNNTGDQIDTLFVGYDSIVRNDGDRANTFNVGFAFSPTGPFTPIPDLSFTSPAALDANGFVTTPLVAFLDNLAADFQNGASLYLEFSSNDSTGSGSRDEFGIDDLSVVATSVPVELMQFSVD